MTGNGRSATDDLANRAEAAWDRYVRILDDWPADMQMHGVAEDWLPRDEWAHHARWMDRAASRLRARAAGRLLKRIDPDEANARWQGEDRALALDAARDRCVAARTAILDSLHALPAERVNDEAITIAAEELVDHLEEHVGFIREALLAQDARLWAATVAALDAAPPDAAHREGPAWSVADVYAHLGRWLEHAQRYIATHLAGQRPESITDFDAANAAWHAEDAGISRDEARERAHAAHADLVLLASSTPLAQWDWRVIGVFSGNTLGHYREHLEYMGLA